MFSTKFWISILILPFFFELHGQEKGTVDSFLEKLKYEYPQFTLIYLNDHIQVKEFVVTNNHVLLMDEKLDSKGRKGSYFYLFNRQSMTALDTLILGEVTPTFERGLFVNNQNLYYRPRTGSLDNYEKKTFYGALTIQFSIDQDQFSPLNFYEDRGTPKSDMFLHFSDMKNFQRFSTKKEVGYSINGNTDAYRFKNLSINNFAKQSLYKYLFPTTITKNGLVLLDGVAKELIIANQNNSEEKAVVLPSEFDQAISNELHYDQQAERLYLRLTFSEDERIYRLSKDEFRLIGIDLPKGFNKISSGIAYKRAVYIDGGKLYVILNIEEEGKSYDGLFMADL